MQAMKILELNEFFNRINYTSSYNKHLIQHLSAHSVFLAMDVTLLM